MLLTKQTEEKLLQSQDIRVFHRTPWSWSDFAGLKWGDQRSLKERDTTSFLKVFSYCYVKKKQKKNSIAFTEWLTGNTFVFISHFKVEGSIKTHQINLFTALFGSAKVIGDPFQISWGWREGGGGVLVSGWALRENRLHADKSLEQIKRQISGKRQKMLTSREQ